MARSKNWEAISAPRRSPRAVKELLEFTARAKKRGDLETWRRGKAVLGYIERRRVVDIAAELDVARGSVNRWLQWYEAIGLEGLETGVAPGAAPRLSDKQRANLVGTIEAGPQAAGYKTGVWTGPMIGDVIERMFGVRYHNHHIPRLLHQLGFSVQRPRKRLARADQQAQAMWLRERLPRDQKKRVPAAAS